MTYQICGKIIHFGCFTESDLAGVPNHFSGTHDLSRCIQCIVRCTTALYPGPTQLSGKVGDGLGPGIFSRVIDVGREKGW